MPARIASAEPHLLPVSRHSGYHVFIYTRDFSAVGVIKLVYAAQLRILNLMNNIQNRQNLEIIDNFCCNVILVF